MYFEDEKVEEVVEETTVEETPAAEEATQTEEAKPEETTEDAPAADEAEGEEVAKEEAAPKASGKPDTATPIAQEFHPGNFNPFERPVNPRFANRPQRENEFEERVLKIKRVIKVTKGGRRFKFSALVVIGDKKGRVGYGVGKHIEVPEAIKKAIKQAKKNIHYVKVVGDADTIPHEVLGHKGASKIMLKPAVEGKGVIASDTVRAVVELAGYRNIYSKSLGSNNPNNVVHATVQGLMQLKTEEEIKELRSEPKPRPHNNQRPNNNQGKGNGPKPAPKPQPKKESKGE